MLHEFRYTLRILRRSPAFTLSAMAALALGIGANTAVFSVVHAVLLRPLPYAEPHRLVRLYENNHAQGITNGDVSPATVVELRTRSRALDDVGAYLAREWLIQFGYEYEQLAAALVSPSVFRILGVAPELGRTFRPEEQQSPPFGDVDEVVIAYDLWQRRFGGARDVLGRTVLIEGRVARRIVGVMPRGFDFPGGAQMWGQETFLRPIGPGQRQARYYRAIARLRPGTTFETSRTELANISTQLADQYRDSHAGFAATLQPLDEATTGSVQPALLAIAGVVGCVLLIACANVASLMLARAAARRRDLAVRSALGATTGRLLRQSFTESAMLSAGGLAGGLLIAWWGSRLLIAAAPDGIPRLDEAGLDGAVLAFTAALAVLCAAITATVPAVQVAFDDLRDKLTSAGRVTPARGRRARSALIAAQVALTMVLLVSAAVLLRSFVRLRGVDLGFDPARVVAADLRFPTSRFADTKRPWVRLAHAYERIVEDVATLPGVEAVGGVTGLPLTGEGSASRMWLGDSAEPPVDANARWTVPVAIVTSGYFRAMRIPLLRGRAFDATDRLSERVLTDPAAPRPPGVVIVNDAFARRYWPGEDPLGRSIRLEDHWAVSASTVVGVAADVREHAVTMPAGPAVYVPWGEIPGFRLALAVRTNGDVSAVAAALRSRLRSLDSHLFVSNLRPLDAVVAGAIARPRFNLLLVASFALLALALAAVGVYGVVAYLVAERTREVGIRIALGALARDVMGLVLADGLKPVLLGITLGLIAALGAVRLMRALLFDLAPADPLSFIAAPAVLLAVAAAAALIPARRAARVDPLVALRDE